MKLSVKLLNSDAQLNNFTEIDALQVTKGETSRLVFQLWDEEKGQRYIPTTAATVVVDISRFPEYFAAVNGTRTTVDYSLSLNAAKLASADDRSLWYAPLTAEQTSNLASSAVRFTLTDGSDIKIFTKPYAIQASYSQE